MNTPPSILTLSDPTRFDADNQELHTLQGEVRPERPSQAQRAVIRNERGVDYFCYLANIPRLGVVRAHYLWTTINS